MGNLAFTDFELETGSDRIAKGFNTMRSSNHPPLELISKPIALGQVVPEEPIWTRLGGSVRDALFAPKLPPLELTSRPIAVPDLMAVKRDPVSSAVSFVMHVVILGLVLYFGFQARKQIIAPQPAVVTLMAPVEVKPFIPVTVPAPRSMGGGGGGGAQQVVQASKGRLPEMAKVQVAPPEMLKIDHPKLAVAPTVVMPQKIAIPTNSMMPNLGVTQSTQVALVSAGSGSGAGFGQGRGGGIGAGRGAGIGSGSVGGYGGGVMSVGGGVAAPQLIHSVKPEFTDAAREAKFQGSVSIQLIVDTQGNPQNIRVVRHLGMGLDEKAIAAMRQYKFKPAMYQGHPVPVQLVYDIDFNLF